jgi:nicotinamide-nucleotide amidase
MAQNLNAEVISIGTEILLGELTDTNSVFIARVLRDLGINLYFMTTVGDNQGRIADAIKIALSRAQVVITCGGLGPTVDDMTRQAVALATERDLLFHQELLDQIAARFAGFKVTMTENNRRQAYLPEDAIVIENPVGTAPGFIVEQGPGAVISLPGVPREMKFLMTEKVVPYLQQRHNLGVIRARILKTAGIGESALDEMIGSDLLELGNPTVGLAAHQGQVDVRVTAKADTIAECERMIADMEVRIRERIGLYIFGTDEDTLEAVLVKQLEQTGLSLAVVHAGIGDALEQLLRSADGQPLASSQTFSDPDTAREAFALPADLTLREMAIHIAETICRDSGAAIGIAIVSYPEVDEDSDSAQSTAVAVYSPNGVRDRVYGFGGRSEIAREWVTRWALASAWRMLREQTGEH